MTNQMIRGLLPLVVVTLGTWASTLPVVAQESESKPAAEEKKTPQVAHITRIVELRHIDPSQAQGLLSGPAVKIRYSRGLPVISISGEPDAVAAAEQAIRELDVPRRGISEQGSENVEILFHLLGAGGEPTASEVAGNDRLRSVVEELKDKFPYRGYQLLETGSLRLRNQQKASVRGYLPGGAPGRSEPASYNFHVSVRKVLDRQDKLLIQLGELVLNLRVPVITGTQDSPGVQYQELSIRSEIDVLEGKTVVVGKASAQASIRGLFLILTANVVE